MGGWGTLSFRRATLGRIGYPGLPECSFHTTWPPRPATYKYHILIQQRPASTASWPGVPATPQVYMSTLQSQRRPSHLQRQQPQSEQQHLVLNITLVSSTLQHLTLTDKIDWELALRASFEFGRQVGNQPLANPCFQA